MFFLIITSGSFRNQNSTKDCYNFCGGSVDIIFNGLNVFFLINTSGSAILRFYYSEQSTSEFFLLNE